MQQVQITKIEEIPGSKYSLKKIFFDYKRSSGEWQSQIREVYDRGNAAAILLYNPDSKNVILTKQFRMPSLLNGNPGGMLIEACAGLLDGDDPQTCAIREAEEEVGIKVDHITKAFEAYMSPGSLTEIIHLFIGEYNKASKLNAGGGLIEEGEDIEVLEINIDSALAQVESGAIKDAKTILLLQYIKLKGIL